MPDETREEAFERVRVQGIIHDAYQAHSAVRKRVKVRRQLITRTNDLVLDNDTGTYLPPPFDKTVLAIRTMVGETAKAAQHYASRIAANNPKVSVAPMTARSKLSAMLDKHAGEQERLDDQLWEENGGRVKQWAQGMNMSVTGAGYYVTLPRDADFGLPDRNYYDDDSEELATMRRDGKLAMRKVISPKTGQLVYAEHDDVWAERRREAKQYAATSGRSLFSLEALPRDMVMTGKDGDGIKWAVTWEEVPGYTVGGGTDSNIARWHARRKGVPEDDVGLWGIWCDRDGRIVGGIERGGPPESAWTRPAKFTITRFFNRIEQFVFISGAGPGSEGELVYRGKHGCRVGDKPACPVVEVAMMHMGINVLGEEFTTPLEAVFAYVPIINQLMTLLTNAIAYNLLPRWVGELHDGSTLRGEDGEPKDVGQETAPGLDPRDIAFYPGKVVQLLIETQFAQDLLREYREALAACMPSASAMGEAGASAAAWQVRLQTQQAQENLRQPVSNHAEAVKTVLQMWHAWLRDLDLPVYFFAEKAAKRGERAPASLIQMDPADLTDSFQVNQALDTPEEATVRIQTGLELRAQGAITWHDFFESYLRVQDAREAEIEMYAEKVVEQVIYGTAFPPGSLMDQLAKGMQGELHQMLIEESDNYAMSVAEQMAAQAEQQALAMQGQAMPAGMGGPPPVNPDGTQGVAQAAGVVEPGMGMDTSLQGQLGQVPGGMAPAAPVAV